MELYFRSEEYFQRAMTLAEAKPGTVHSGASAFAMLLNGIAQEALENLLQHMEQAFPSLTKEECYALTQGHSIPGKVVADDEAFYRIRSIALDCLRSGQFLSTSFHPSAALVGHCLFVGEACRILADVLGLDPDRAMAIGTLHDYGRRADGTLGHVLRGFEMLSDAGWMQESLGCLTHSFLGGGRCASNEMAETGFYVDEAGTPCWEPDAVRDHITQFLSVYSYTDYDRILNLADLMATSYGIVSPAERIKDIATRRTIDPTNRGYFLASLTNCLREYTAVMNKAENTQPKLYAAAGISLKEIEDAFREASDRFWDAFCRISG